MFRTASTSRHLSWLFVLTAALVLPVSLLAQPADWGDAPDPTYPTLQASDGARHTLGTRVFLGTCVDGDLDGQPSTEADGDDLAIGSPVVELCTNDDDEDGVTFTTPLSPGNMASVDLRINEGCTISAWIDFDANGDWSGSEEDLFPGGATLAEGNHTLSFPVPSGAQSGFTFARFRCTTEGAVGFTGVASDGEVEDYSVLIGGGLDFGDAADPTFPTLLANDGARHALGSDVFLGTCVDSEADGQPSASADGDDTHSGTTFGACTSEDDEDGVVLTSLLTGGANASVNVVASAACTLSAWIDFSADGDWDEADEMLFPGGQALVTGSNSLSFAVPAGAVVGNQGARFRCTTDGEVSFTGEATDGEVEDYQVPIGAARDFGDAFTLLDSGAPPSHLLGSNVFLGTCVDAEASEQVSGSVDGDDLAAGNPVFGTCSNADDEDGVTFTSPLVADEMATVDVVASAPCTLSAWIDFDGNATFTGSGEDLFPGGQALTTGTNSLSFTVPPSAASGTLTTARFRCTTAGAVSFDDEASDGEVEDYAVMFEPLDFGDAPDPTFPTLRANDGARHALVPGSRVLLGSCVDAELDGLPNSNANGDDNNQGNPAVGNCESGDDEDGVVFTGSALVGGTVSFDVTALEACTLSAWIDFGDDGSWAEAGDELFPGGQPLAAGTTSLSAPVPASAATGSTFARFRCTTDGPVGFTGLASDGEVEDHSLIIGAGLDFGDAPGFFPTVAAANGARHTIGGPFLGACVDGEVDGISSGTVADSDDLASGSLVLGTCVDGDDEDGVVFTTPLTPGAMATVDVTASAPCSLSAWIDFNANGFWFEANNRIFNGQALSAGVNNLSFTVPGNAVPFLVQARFRCTTDGAVNFVGQASDGEVEDHSVTIGALVDYGDAPDPTFPTLEASSGASHILGSGVFLGACVDPEGDGQPSAGADGDDLGVGSPTFGTCVATDDEDGVIFTSSLVGGAMATVDVTANAACTLSAWIDFDGNGDWIGTGEDIFPGGQALAAGVNSLSFAVPAGAAAGDTLARFRCTTDGAVAFTGQASDGEVEDYPLAITGLDFGDAPDPTYPTRFGSDGPRHRLGGGAFLGGCIDAEGDGQPTAGADGDDLATGTVSNGNCPTGDDEDGVLFNTGLTPGGSADISVTAFSACTLSAWVDFDGNGDWTGTGEDIFPGGQLLAPGPNGLSFAVPVGAIAGTTFARFRCTTDGPVSFTGEATDGEVEDYQVAIGSLQDFGDAPAGYPTLLADDGARHDLGGSLFLGFCTDAEADGQTSATSMGDDLAAGSPVFGACAGGDDEDGVSFASILVPGKAGNTSVRASEACTLSAWVDFDGNGDWSGTGEDIFPGGQALTAGANALSFPVPVDAASGIAAARFRCTTDGAVSFTGSATDGEVEDHAVTIASLDFGDAPDPSFPTSIANNGARHAVAAETQVFLGACVDRELDGQASAAADGDDLDIGAAEGICVDDDDEDGVAFVSPLLPGTTATIEVLANGACTLSAWIDFDGNGDWSDFGDELFPGGQALASAPNTLTFDVPATAVPGATFARFRCTTDGPIGFDGAAFDGEVEDYQVTVSPLADYGDAPDPTFPTLTASNGASHGLGSNVFLGACVDAEGDGQPSALGDGDDEGASVQTFGTCLRDDDEDGVTFTSLLLASSNATATVTASEACTLSAWIDFDGNGDWSGSGEDLFPGGQALAAGANSLSFAVPVGAVNGNTFARFRCTTDGAVGFDGTASDGEVEDYQIPVGPAADYGDAPDPTFPTLAASSGASHLLGSGVYLGACVDGEVDGQPDPTAAGDDGNTGNPVFGPCGGEDDEDGVRFTSLISAGSMATVEVTASAACTLSAWIDFAGDGAWTQAGDELFSGGTALAAGVNMLSFSVPGSVALSDVAARFRCTTDGAVSFTGQASDGEVEDVVVALSLATDLGDAPDSYQTSFGAGGPRHLLGSGVFLGACVDAESSGNPSADAQGDDLTVGNPVFGTCVGEDDEDGVTFTSAVVGDQMATIDVVASAACTLSAWADFDGGGAFENPAESLFLGGQLLAAGTNNLSFAVPTGELPNPLNLRFRCATAGPLTPASLAFDGEVEDYQVVAAGMAADLTIAKSDDADPVVAGRDTITYTIDVSNAGPNDADDVVVSDLLPPGLTLVATSGCIEDPVGIPVCNLGSIASGSSAQLTITASVDASTLGVITNTASVTSSTFLLNTDDDMVSEETAVEAEADLVITKSDSVDPVIAGNVLTYTIVVTNAGPSDATGVQVTDTLPAGVTLLSTGGCAEDPNGVPTCSLGSIAVGQMAQYTIAVGVDTGTLGTIANMASVSATTPLINTGDDTVTEETTVEASADLSITKSDSPDPVIAGNTLTYTITVDNAGPSDATGVFVADTLPAGVTFTSTTGCTEDPNGVPTCGLGTVAAGGSTQFTIEVMVDTDTLGMITNTAAVASSTNDPDTGNNTASEQTTVEAEADLSIAKSDSPDPVIAGNTLTYTVTVSNAGPSDATGVSVADTLPAGVTFTSTTGCAEDPNGVPTCGLGTVTAGGSAQFTIEVMVDADTLGAITNTASVASDTTDPNGTNDTATEETMVTAEADLSVTKEDSQDPIAVGANLTYTITVDNAGPSDALGVEVTETLPAGVTFVSTTGCDNDPSAVPVCELGTILSGESDSYTVEVTVDAATPSGTITNTVMVNSDAMDPDTGNDTASEDTLVDAEPPTVTLIDTSADTGDGELEECEEARTAISQLLVSFSEPVRNPPGDDDPDDVTNPANYLLVASGPDQDFSTDVCGSAAGDDIAFGIDAVTYNGMSQTATLTIANAPLGDSLYRLLVCGSTSIQDVGGNPLDGDGNGTGGDDFVRTYRVERTNLLANGHFDCSIDSWIAVSTLPAEIAYSSEDFVDSSVSGSAEITNLSASTDFTLGQCAPVSPASSCQLTGRVRVDAAANVVLSQLATCEYFAQADCAGTSVGTDATVRVGGDTAGQWQPIELSSVVPGNARSALCSLDVRTATGEDFDAFFDEAILACTVDVIFADGFESGDTSAWTATLP